MSDSSTPELKALPKYGELITMEEWLNAVKGGWFIPYDGSGHWATATNMDSSSDVWSGDPPEWATHVMWFNR